MFTEFRKQEFLIKKIKRKNTKENHNNKKANTQRLKASFASFF